MGCDGIGINKDFLQSKVGELSLVDILLVIEGNLDLVDHLMVSLLLYQRTGEV
ncbi:hypothetical protein SDC9_114692 [bioreactor metagenome]|uniref:Uncharacterized protein n=1 Tax=bioreactor metagenome TaxID=1076179 RepID=A0A645BRQ3_9ZZZZ